MKVDTTATTLVEEAKRKYGEKCNGSIHYGTWARSRRCRTTARFFEPEWDHTKLTPYARSLDSRATVGPTKGYCGTHAPSKIKTRREARDNLRQAGYDRRQERNQKRRNNYAGQIVKCTGLHEAQQLVMDIAAWGRWLYATGK